MLATKTRFTAFAEPELLSPIETATIVPTRALADVDAVIDRINRELLASGPSILPTAISGGWTHVALDPAPLVLWMSISTVTTDHRTWEDIRGAELVTVLWTGVATHGDALPSGGQTSHLDASLAEIQSWLGIGLGPAAEAAGISRGTVYAWRHRGSSPRPGTVGAIMRVHGLVAAAVSAVGVERAREWFHAGDPPPLSEMVDAQGNADRLQAISTRLRRELLRVPVPPPNPLVAATVDDIVR